MKKLLSFLGLENAQPSEQASNHVADTCKAETEALETAIRDKLIAHLEARDIEVSEKTPSSCVLQVNGSNYKINVEADREGFAERGLICFFCAVHPAWQMEEYQKNALLNVFLSWGLLEQKRLSSDDLIPEGLWYSHHLPYSSNHYVSGNIKVVTPKSELLRYLGL